MLNKRLSIPTFVGAAALFALSACSFSDSMDLDGHGAGDIGSYAPEGDYASGTAGENYEDYGVNPVVDASEDNKSTFAIDVDTGSYTLMRRDINQGFLPNQAGVRVEEYVNYFDYDYGQPSAEHPFAVHLESAQSHFGQGHELVRIGLQGLTMPEAERSPANLVFLIDVSGSMMAANKLDLIKSAFGLLVEKLNEGDTVSIVTYAGNEGVALEATSGDQDDVILAVLDDLRAGGSTNGEAGIRLAYDMAEATMKEGGINRVILCTDGDLNVGLTGTALENVIEDFRERGIFLTTLGFGMGNYNDASMEQLANKGNGNYAYIDGMQEAQRVFQDKLLGTLQVIAKDVKIQLEFNTDYVNTFRLIGYENRMLEHQDFEDDTKDAGELGSGHNVTALYEITFHEDVDVAAGEGSIVDVSLRYKQPDGEESVEFNTSLEASNTGSEFSDAGREFRFAAAVAEFAEILRGSEFAEGSSIADVQEIAQGAAADKSERLEFVSLVEQAAGMF
jgi:Ca-activated chloride channel family protein